MKETLITGGHFMIIDGLPNLNEGTIKSFEIAVKFHKKRIKNSILGILINDIGVTCGQEKCLITNAGKFSRDSFALPPEYIDILKENSLSENDVEIFWEKYIRNRAKRFFRKKFRENYKFIENNNTYFYEHPRTKKLIPLSEKTKESPYGIPRCALIMAQFYKEIEKKGFKENYNFYYAGKDNLINIPNPKPIECGMALSEFVDQNIRVENIFI